LVTVLHLQALWPQQALLNGAALTGIVASAGAAITNGTSNVSISGSGANVTVSVAGVGNVAVFSATDLTVSGNLLPAGDVLKNIGSATNAFNDLFLANGTIYLGNASISANATSIIMTNESGQQTVLTGSGTVTPYGNSNVAAYLPTYTGAMTAMTGNITTTGNVSGTYFIGNGALLTGISGGGTPTSIVNGTSNVVAAASGNVTVGVAGTAGVATFATTGEYVTGLISASGNITSGANVSGQYILGNGAFLTGVASSYGNADVSNYLASGTDTANIITTGNISAAGNINANTNVVVTPTVGTLVLGDATATNSPGLSSTASLTLTANRAGTAKEMVLGSDGALTTQGNISTSANISGGNLITTGTVSTDWLTIGNVGNITSLAADVKLQIVADAGNTAPYWTFNNDGNLFVPGDISGDNSAPLIVEGSGSGEGYISLPYATFGGEQVAIVNKFSLGNGIRLETNGGNLFLSDAGALTTPGNVTATGQISATGNIVTTANIAGGNLSLTGAFSPASVTAIGNVAGGNLTTQGQVSATGNITTAGYFVGNFAGNITGNIVVPGSNTQILFNTNGNADAVGGFTYNKDSNTMTVLGIVSAQGNVVAGNVNTVHNDSVGCC